MVENKSGKEVKKRTPSLDERARAYYNTVESRALIVQSFLHGYRRRELAHARQEVWDEGRAQDLAEEAGADLPAFLAGVEDFHKQLAAKAERLDLRLPKPIEG